MASSKTVVPWLALVGAWCRTRANWIPVLNDSRPLAVYTEVIPGHKSASGKLTQTHPELGNIVPGVFTPVLAKHTKSFNLVNTFSVRVDRIQRNFEPMQRCGLDNAGGGAVAIILIVTSHSSR